MRHSRPPPLISTDTIGFPHAGDYSAVKVTIVNPLAPRPAPPPVIGSVSRRPSSFFRKFSRHMSQWSKAHSTNQDHVMHPLDTAEPLPYLQEGPTGLGTLQGNQ